MSRSRSKPRRKSQRHATERRRERPDGEVCGKVRHGTKGSAKNHARSLKSREGYIGEVYWCNCCRAWHVGSRKMYVGYNRALRSGE